ncbi:alpha-ketoacid dehydrogenase subunit beta [Paraglaciecola sp. MB-3u-78]|jgi:pyruvate dehydrogenase E1 component beta subunit|uniref:alpha-ketoacid dehydrogenase subunit beta n=1 Tax=Paraglaciecola sp. MB-3u-78 TaxID=2058332 RepID=UPI000C321663|nr:transketolase C-terminal domain-containing protein [Paraglaciecola sp. MB-3u-78]PKH00824.1 alpha-ketoacid dehydrogenase subunit beta [Paraglaciecola sp. MB-3u-78]
MLETANFADEINRAQHQSMQMDSSMLSFGLGIDDPKGIFGTTSGLAKAFGSERVFDMPTAENAMTGIGIGAAIAGSRVLMTHQRLDFFLLAMDQLVNNAAKWHYMFNGMMKVPITIRLIIGRGWGQGPTHAQNLQAWFAHVPGLKVVVPSRTENVAQQLHQAIMDDNPVLFIEHRWLHQQSCHTESIVSLEQPLEHTQIVREGKNITVVANSYMLLEALRAAEHLAELGIDCEVIDTACLHQINWSVLHSSIEKTGHLLVCDSARKEFSCGAEILANLSENCFGHFNRAPVRLGLPDYPEPTSYGLTKDFYPCAQAIACKISELLGSKKSLEAHSPLEQSGHHDVPGSWFKGPF